MVQDQRQWQVKQVQRQIRICTVGPLYIRQWWCCKLSAEIAFARAVLLFWLLFARFLYPWLFQLAVQWHLGLCSVVWLKTENKFYLRPHKLHEHAFKTIRQNYSRQTLALHFQLRHDQEILQFQHLVAQHQNFVLEVIANFIIILSCSSKAFIFFQLTTRISNIF